MISLKAIAALTLAGLIGCLVAPTYVGAQATGEYGTTIGTDS